MAQQTPGQARILDPVLSEYARGYVQPGLVGRSLFPIVPVQMYGGKIIEFGKEAFRLYNTQRAPGSNTKRIASGFQGKPFSISPSALEATVPRELMRDAEQVPGIDLGSRAVSTVLRAMNLEHEVNCATISRLAANYDSAHKVALLGTSRWAGSTSDPSADIEAAKEAIRASIGVRPNTAILSPSAMNALTFNAKILDRIKYTSRDTPTEAILSQLWGIKNVIRGDAVVSTNAADDFGDVWGDDVVLAYVSGNTQANAEEPSYGYTYAIEGMPLVEQPYWDNSAKSWVYGVSFDNSPVLSGMVAGYLIQDAGGAPA